MKSLEIINRYIKAIKKLLRNLQNAKEGTTEDFDKYYHEQELKEQLAIKQDLEVLEIIRKKEVNVRTLQYYLSAFKDKKDIVLLNLYNAFLEENFKLTMEELLKLKQWLEVNENENS